MASRGDIDIKNIQPKLSEKWMTIPFELSLDKTPKYIKHKTKGLSLTGRFPVVDQGESKIAGYIQDDKKIYQGKLPVVIFGDHTRIIKYVDFPFAVGADGTKIFRPKDKFSSRFFFYYLTALSVPDLGYSRHFKILKEVQVPVPPRPEQDRIVDKVDILMAQVETMQKSLESIPQLLKDFRQQVLTQAVTGKLTEDWRENYNFSPVKLFNELNPIELSVFKYSQNLKGWKVTALGNYASVARGKFSARPRNDPRYFNGKYPFSQIGDLPREGGDYDDFSSTLNEEGKKVSKLFPVNTVMIAIVGATIGNTGMNTIEMYFPDSMIGINSDGRTSNQFIEYHLRVSKYKFREIASASGGQPNIKIPTIKNLEIAIPPLEEQKEIVRRVEGLFTKADAIEAQYKTLKTKIETLPQAILHKAFKGELVEQLPTDGDAKELLREIKGLKQSISV